MRRVEFVERDPNADILVVTNLWPEPERPVYGIFVQRQVESLRAAGARCDVLYIRGWTSPLAYPEAALRMALASLLWRGRYRVVHAHAGEAALAARCFVGVPMVASYLGDDLLGDRDDHGGVPVASRVRRWVVQQHAGLFAATITKSKEMHDALPPRARRTNHVVPNGVDVETFAPRDRAESRAALGWGDAPRALFAATKPRTPRKRLWLAEQACAAAGVRLVVAEGVAPGELPVWMNAADCLLLTSSLEGSPNAVKEAVQCNLPVVATDVGDVAERLEGVVPSWICEPTVDAFAAALRECIEERRRSNGRSVAADLDERFVARRILDLYDAVAA